MEGARARLLERDHPLAVLHDRARAATERRGSLVLVAGEAGIGKTALLRAFAEDAPAPVLSGMCDPLSTPRPLGPLWDVAGELGPAVTAVPTPPGSPTALVIFGDRVTRENGMSG